LTNMTLSIPPEIYTIMKKHPEIKWTHIMRQAATDLATKIAKDEHKKYAYVKARQDWSDARELFEF
jgi:hypothetical protein